MIGSVGCVGPKFSMDCLHYFRGSYAVVLVCVHLHLCYRYSRVSGGCVSLCK